MKGKYRIKRIRKDNERIETISSQEFVANGVSSGALAGVSSVKVASLRQKSLSFFQIAVLCFAVIVFIVSCIFALTSFHSGGPTQADYATRSNFLVAKTSYTTTYVSGVNVHPVGEVVREGLVYYGYYIEPNSTFKLNVVNETKIFSEWRVSLVDLDELSHTNRTNASTTALTMPTTATDDNPLIVSTVFREPITSDRGKYMFGAYGISSETHMLAYMYLLNKTENTQAGIVSVLKEWFNDDSITNTSDIYSNNDVYHAIQTGYFKITEAFTITASAFEGVGNSSNNAFKGVFDGNNINIEMVVTHDYGSVHAQNEYMGFFGCLGESGISDKPCVVRNLSVAGSVTAKTTTSSYGALYLGGIAGYIDKNVVLRNITCGTSVAGVAENTGISAGMFAGYIRANIDYDSHVTVEAPNPINTLTSLGDARISLGTLAGTAEAISVSSFDINCGSLTSLVESQHGGQSVVGGFIGSYNLGENYAQFDNINLICQNAFVVRAIGDGIYIDGSTSVTTAHATSATAGGFIGTIYTTFENLGELEIIDYQMFANNQSYVEARSLDSNSVCNVFAGGHVGYVNRNIPDEKIYGTSEYYIGENTQAHFLIDAPLTISAIQNGKTGESENQNDGNSTANYFGRAVAGGLVAFGSVRYSPNDDSQAAVIFFNNPSKPVTIEATQTQTSSHIETLTNTALDRQQGFSDTAHIAAGIKCGLISDQMALSTLNNNLALKNTTFIASNVTVKGVREEGSTTYGNINVGGLVGFSAGVDYDNINLLMNDCVIAIESMSHRIKYTNTNETTANNTIDYAGLNCAFLGGLVGNFMSSSNSYAVMNNCNIAGYIYDSNNPLVYTNAQIGSYGTTAHIEGIQNTIAHSTDFIDELYVGGLVGRQMFADITNSNFYGHDSDKDGIFMFAHYNPNTAMAGGIVGYTRVAPNDNTGTDITNCHVTNTIIRADATNNDAQEGTKDILVGGIVGALWISNQGRATISQCEVAYNEILVYGYGTEAHALSAGIAGGVAWSGTSTITGCIAYDNIIRAVAHSGVDTYQGSDKSMAVAGGIVGHNFATVTNCGAINNVIEASSRDNQVVAGIVAQMNGVNADSNNANGSVRNCYSNSLLKIDAQNVNFYPGQSKTNIYAIARAVSNTSDYYGNYYHESRANSTTYLLNAITGVTADRTGVPIKGHHRQLYNRTDNDVNYTQTGYTTAVINTSTNILTEGTTTTNDNQGIDIINSRENLPSGVYHLEVTNTSTFMRDGVETRYWQTATANGSQYLVSRLQSGTTGSATYLYVWFRPQGAEAVPAGQVAYVPSTTNINEAHEHGWYMFIIMYAQRNTVEYDVSQVTDGNKGNFVNKDYVIYQSHEGGNVYDIDNLAYQNDFTNAYIGHNSSPLLDESELPNSNYVERYDVHIKVHSSQEVLRYYGSYPSSMQISFTPVDPSRNLNDYASYHFNQVNVTAENVEFLSRATNRRQAELLDGDFLVYEVVLYPKLGATKDLISNPYYTGYGELPTLTGGQTYQINNEHNYIYSPNCYFEVATIPATFEVTRVFLRMYLNFYVNDIRLVGHKIDQSTIPANTAENPDGSENFPYQFFINTYYTVLPVVTHRFDYTWVENDDLIMEKQINQITERRYTHLVNYNMTNNAGLSGSISDAGELLISTLSKERWTISIVLDADPTQVVYISAFTTEPIEVDAQIVGGYFDGLMLATQDSDYLFRIKNLTGYSPNMTKLHVEIEYLSGISINYHFDRNANALLADTSYTISGYPIEGVANQFRTVREYIFENGERIGWRIEISRKSVDSHSTHIIPLVEIKNLYGETSINIKRVVIGSPYSTQNDNFSVASRINVEVEYPIEYKINLYLNNDFDQREIMTDDLRLKTFTVEKSELTHTYATMFGVGTQWHNEIQHWISGNQEEFETDFLSKYGVKLYGYEIDGFYLIDQANSGDNYGTNIYRLNQEITTSNNFYARWLYQIEYIETPGTDISANFVESYLLEANNIKIPIDTNQGFRFIIHTDSAFEGDPRLAVISYGYADPSYSITENSGTETIDQVFEVKQIIPEKVGANTYSIKKEDISGYLVVITYATNTTFIAGESTLPSQFDIIPEDGVYTLYYVANHRRDDNTGNASFAFAAENAANNKELYIDISYALPINTEIKLYYRDYTHQNIQTECVGYYKIDENTFSDTDNNPHVRREDGNIVGYSIISSDFRLMDFMGNVTDQQFESQTFGQYTIGTNAKTEYYYFVITPPSGTTTFHSDGSTDIKTATVGYKYINNGQLTWVKQARVDTIYDIETIKSKLKEGNITDCVSEVTVDFLMYPTRQTYISHTNSGTSNATSAQTADVEVVDVKSIVDLSSLGSNAQHIMPNDYRHTEKHYVLAISLIRNNNRVNLKGTTLTVSPKNTSTYVDLDNSIIGTETIGNSFSIKTKNISNDVYYYYVPIFDLVGQSYIELHGNFTVSATGNGLDGAVVDVELLESESQSKPAMGELLGLKVRADFDYTQYQEWNISDKTQYVKYGDSLTRPVDPVYPAYIFDNWYYLNNGVETLFDFNTEITGNVQIYAKWIPVVFGYENNLADNGSQENPYLIGNTQSADYSLRQLQTLSGLVNGTITHYDGQVVNRQSFYTKHYKLSSDIEISGTWNPIGNDNNPFSGVFDGNNHTITFGQNSNIEEISIYGFAGLFGVAGTLGAAEGLVYGQVGYEYYSVEIKNLTVGGVIIVPYCNYVGAIAGSVVDALITNCTSSAYIRGMNNVGGIVGLSVASIIQNCQTTATIFNGENYQSGAYIIGNNDVGGIVGRLDNTYEISVQHIARQPRDNVIDNAVNRAHVRALDGNAGGICAECRASYILNCANEEDAVIKATGVMSEMACVGGISGRVYLNSYCMNNINYGEVRGETLDASCESYVGGAVGRVGLAFIANCVNTGDVYGVTNVGLGVGGVVNVAHLGYNYTSNDAKYFILEVNNGVGEYIEKNDQEKKIVGYFSGTYKFPANVYYFVNDLNSQEKPFTTLINNGNSFTWEEHYIHMLFADELSRTELFAPPTKIVLASNLEEVLDEGARWLTDYANIAQFTIYQPSERYSIKIRKWEVSDILGNQRIQFGDAINYEILRIETHTDKNIEEVSAGGALNNSFVAGSAMNQNLSGGTVHNVRNQDGSNTFTAIPNAGFRFIGFYKFLSNEVGAGIDNTTNSVLSRNLVFTCNNCNNLPHHTVVALFESTNTTRQLTVQIYNNQTNRGVIQDATGKYEPGTRVMFSATPFSDYAFDGWYDITDMNTRISSNSSYIYVTGDVDRTIVAKFLPEKYLKGVDVVGLGSIDIIYTEDGVSYTDHVQGVIDTSVPGYGEYNSATQTWMGEGRREYYNEITVTCQVVEDLASGYRFVGWFRNNELISSATSISIITDRTVDIIEALFQRVVDMTFTTNNGKIYIDGQTDDSAFHTYSINSAPTYTATGTFVISQTMIALVQAESNNLYFDGWYIIQRNGVATDLFVSKSERLILIAPSEAVTLEARYSNIVVTLNNKYNGEVNVSYLLNTQQNAIIDESHPNWVAKLSAQSQVELTVPQPKLSQFVGWYDTINGNLLSTASTYTVTIPSENSATVIEARFINFELSINDASQGRTVTYTALDEAPVVVNSANPSSVKGYAVGKRISITRDGTKAGFMGWYVNDRLESNAVAFEYTVKEGNNIIEARYTNTTISVNNLFSGSMVVRSSNTILANITTGNNPWISYFSSGTTLTLEAYANPGEEFYGWEVSTTNGHANTVIINPGTGILLADERMMYTTTYQTTGIATHIQAIFNNVVIFVENTSFGSASANGKTTSQANNGTISINRAVGSTVTMTATQNSASSAMFVGWYKDGTLLSTQTTYTYTVLDDINIIEARFSQLVSLTVSANNTYTGNVQLYYDNSISPETIINESTDGVGSSYERHDITPGTLIRLVVSIDAYKETRFTNSFRGWYQGDQEITNGGNYTITNNGYTIEFTMSSTVNIQARFDNTYVYLNNGYANEVIISRDGAVLGELSTDNYPNLAAISWSGYLIEGEEITLTAYDRRDMYENTFKGYFVNDLIYSQDYETAIKYYLGSQVANENTVYDAWTFRKVATTDSTIIEARSHNLFVDNEYSATATIYRRSGNLLSQNPIGTIARVINNITYFSTYIPVWIESERTPYFSRTGYLYFNAYHPNSTSGTYQEHRNSFELNMNNNLDGNSINDCFYYVHAW